MRNAALTACALSFAALAAGPALAKAPYFAARCGDGISVETDRAGRAYIDGKKAKVTSRSANFHTISVPGVSIDVSSDGNGPLTATYTGRNRANGVCEILEQETVESSAPAPAQSAAPAAVADDVPAQDKKACLRAVQRQTKNKQVAVIQAVSSEANNTVTVGVGPQRAPWRCLVKRGRVADVMSQSDEGGL